MPGLRREGSHVQEDRIAIEARTENAGGAEGAPSRRELHLSPGRQALFAGQMTTIAARFAPIAALF